MVMAVLSEQPDRSMQMSDIARGASASLSRLSHTAKRLEKQGYLKRARCPGAGRRTRATLTRAGYEKVVATAPGHVATVRRLLVDAVTPAQLEAVRQVGQTVLTRIDPHERCVPPA
jgi:DNA-binding MarR family transcriptional regulator